MRHQCSNQVKCSHAEHPVPSNCRNDRLFVPASPSQVLQWGHAPHLACHPRVRRILTLQWFWSRLASFVPNMKGCAKLQLVFFIPCRAHFTLGPTSPWYVTGLPSSEGKLFSQLWLVQYWPIHCITQASYCQRNHAFHLHGIPMTWSLAEGHSLLSHFWSEFCSLLGATVSLSSGFQPQSNGQAERMNQEMEKALRCHTFPSPGPSNS